MAGSCGSALKKYHFLQLCSVGQDEALARHVAQSGMETLYLAGKWAEVGGAIMDAVELPRLQTLRQEGSTHQSEPEAAPTGRVK